jgi:DNA-directed RNA polymerase beta' subunit
MAVHLPLYESSQLEARTMMRPSYNVLSPSNGEVILKPTQDMVIGCYYLTLMISKNKYILQKWFANETEAFSAFYQKKITLHTPILVRYSISNIKFQIDTEKLKFSDTTKYFTVADKDIIIIKKIQGNNKHYLLTNIGIFIAENFNQNKYLLTNLFLETTPGRLIFGLNYKKSIKE